MENDTIKTTQPIISVKDLKKYFKDVKAVDGVNFEIEKGSYVALLGPNGAGKTTVMEMLEGIQLPDSGEISISGMNWANNQDEIRRMIGLALQETRFVDKLTVNETLKLFASFYRLPYSRNDEVLQLVGLTEKRKSYTVNLSGGQRQKLALAIALLNKPEILLLDEPTTGLDPSARRDIWDILVKLRDEINTTLILTTHYMDEAEYLCNRIIIMDKGHVLDDDTKANLMQKYAKKEIVVLSADQNIEEDWFTGLGVNHYAWDRAEMKGTLELENIARNLPQVLAMIQSHNIALNYIETRRMTLDDLFISMTGRRLNE
jgi:ABC-2 type transport system ATP-binding protein